MIMLQVSSESQFEYAWCLVRSRYPADIRKGIILLEDLFQVKHCFFLRKSDENKNYTCYNMHIFRIETTQINEITSTI